MANNLVIDVKVNDAELVEYISLLEKSGLVEKSITDDFRKYSAQRKVANETTIASTEEAYQETVKLKTGTEQLAASINKLPKTIISGAVSESMKTLHADITKTTSATGGLKNGLLNISNSASVVAAELQGATSSAQGFAVAGEEVANVAGTVGQGLAGLWGIVAVGGAALVAGILRLYRYSQALKDTDESTQNFNKYIKESTDSINNLASEVDNAITKLKILTGEISKQMGDELGAQKEFIKKKSDANVKYYKEFEELRKKFNITDNEEQVANQAAVLGGADEFLQKFIQLQTNRDKEIAEAQTLLNANLQIIQEQGYGDFIKRATKFNEERTQVEKDYQTVRTQAEIDLMAEGMEKELAQYRLDFSKKEDELRKAGVTQLQITELFAQGRGKIITKYENLAFEEQIRIISNEYAAKRKLAENELKDAEGQRQYLAKLAKEEEQAKEKAYRDDLARKRKQAQEERQIEEDSYQASVSIINSFQSINQSASQQEINDLQNLLNQKRISQNAYDARVREIKRKDAERDKQLALFNIALSTAQAIIKAYTDAPYPANIALSIAAAVAGAAQVAAVESKPVPAFRKGTKNAPSGWAWVGEEGAELVKLRGGEEIKTHRDSIQFAKLYFDEEALKNIPMVPAIIPVNNASAGFDYDKLATAIANKTKDMRVQNTIIINNRGNETQYYEENYKF